MCELQHIKKTRTTPYHPQSDGMVERFDKMLVTMLRTQVNGHYTDWDAHVPFVTMAYMSSVHEKKGCTSNKMITITHQNVWIKLVNKGHNLFTSFRTLKYLMKSFIWLMHKGRQYIHDLFMCIIQSELSFFSFNICVYEYLNCMATRFTKSLKKPNRVVN